MTPTQRSLKWLREDYGFRAEVVEKVIPYCKLRHDLFGFIDIVAIRPSCILAVQTTSRSNFNARLAKALALPALSEWLRAGGSFQVHGWGKTGKRGATKCWELTSHTVTLQEAEEAIKKVESIDEPGTPTNS